MTFGHTHPNPSLDPPIPPIRTMLHLKYCPSVSGQGVLHLFPFRAPKATRHCIRTRNLCLPVSCSDSLRSLHSANPQSIHKEFIVNILHAGPCKELFDVYKDSTTALQTTLGPFMNSLQDCTRCAM